MTPTKIRRLVYFCPRGCQSITADVHPEECGACGARFTTDETQYGEVHQALESTAIERFLQSTERDCDGHVASHE